MALRWGGWAGRLGKGGVRNPERLEIGARLPLAGAARFVAGQIGRGEGMVVAPTLRSTKGIRRG